MWKLSCTPVLAAITLVSALTPAHASSIHYAWEYPESYRGSGSAYPAQAAPGATVYFRAKLVERYAVYVETSAPTTFQWYFNDVAITGETGSSLTLRNVTAAHSGNYSVRWTQNGFVNERDYFPLTVVAPPATPLVSSVTIPFGTNGGTATMPLGNFENGRSAFLRYYLSSSYYFGTIYVVGPGGTVEQQLSPGGASGPAFPNLLPSGRYLYPTQPIPGLYALNGNQEYAMRTLEELPDGRVLGVVYPFRVVPQPETVFRLNADLTLDSTFNSAANQFRAQAVRDGLRYLLWQDRVLTSLLEDGTADPGFTPISIDTLWPELAGTPVAGSAGTVLPLDDGTLMVAVSLPVNSPTGRLFARLTSSGALIPGSKGATDSVWQSFHRDGNFYSAQGGRAGTWRFRTAGTIGDDPTFYAGVEGTTNDPWDWVRPRAAGGLLAGKVTGTGVVLAHLRTTDAAAPLLPAVIGARVDPISPGGRVTIVPRVIGLGTLSYQWVSLDGGELPANATSPTLIFDSFTARNVGDYQLRITGPNGTSLSPVYRLVPDQPVQLLALSGRGVTDTGPDALIAGWAHRANGTLLARGVGPTLSNYGVQHFASDPIIATSVWSIPLRTANDDWSASLRPVFAQWGASPLLDGSKDAAAEIASAYLGTLQVRNNTGRGVALAEVYDTTLYLPGQIHLNALSLRGFSGPGEDTLIGGFVLGDPSGLERPQRLLLRVVGPTLANYGVPQPLADPVLQLFDARGTLLSRNDDWENGSAQEVAQIKDATERVGLIPHPAGSRDSSVYVELTPGAYTVHASGAGGGTGTALIEIYRVD